MTKTSRNYNIVTLTRNIPEQQEIRDEFQGHYDEKGNFIVDNTHEQSTTETTIGPSEEYMRYFNETIRPSVEAKYGYKDGEFKTPLSDLVGYDVEAERKKREKEKELNEFKRKEANWYNGISTLLDIAAAAGGADVQKRQHSDAAEKATAANEKLDQEAQVEEAAISKARQERLAAMYDELNEVINSATTKVRTTTKPILHKHSITSKPARTETRQEVVRKPDGNSSGRNINVTVNPGTQIESREGYKLSNADFDSLKGSIKAEYNKILANGTEAEKTELVSFLKSIGALKTEDASNLLNPSGGSAWKWIDEDAIMHNGSYFKLPTSLQNQIISKVGDNDLMFESSGNTMRIVRKSTGGAGYKP